MKAASFLADVPGLRLDQFLTQRLAGYSRSYVKDLIERGLVKVDGGVRSPDFRLRGGEVVQLAAAESAWSALPFEDWILHEDKDLLVLNKPAGLLTHPMGDSWLRTPEAALSDQEANVAGLLFHHRPDAQAAGVSRCGIVHRLDRQTSGLLLAALNPAAQDALLTAFRDRTVEKAYRALLWGVLGETTVEAPVGRPSGRRKVKVSPWGKDASTGFSPIETLRGLTLAEARPKTGRTHQIRAHAAHAGCPVLGDPEIFGPAEFRKLDAAGLPPPPRMMLHAYRIRFAHPRTGKAARFTAPLPKDFKDYLKALKA